MSSPTGPTAAADAQSEPPTKRSRPSRVVLNVGGQRFQTTALTLCSSSSSYFTSLFGDTGDALGGHSDEDEVFIDRSGAVFTHVLQWLRSASLPAAVQGDAMLLTDLRVEAEYFCLDALVSACQERIEALTAPPEPKPTARCFSVRVYGCPAHFTDVDDTPYQLNDWEELPEPGEGEVVYIHSVVLGGKRTELHRITDLRTDTEKGEDFFARTGVYLKSNLHNFGGHFELRYATNDNLNEDEEDEDRQFVVARRGLDIGDAGEKQLVDINFREEVHLFVDKGISMAAVGHGHWDVHGWVGPLEAIPCVTLRS